ncbi:MAG: TRAP transporter large permease subunit, partial [Bdellovibrionales bacterium]|nr:TRAP transporter large permease subunit [Bdellovibrionales bacterium]
MNFEVVLPLLMFVLLFIFVLIGIPVAFALMGAALFAGTLGYLLDLFYLSDFGLIPDRLFELVIQNFTLIAVPLFIFMGITLEKSGIAERLLLNLEFLFRSIRGGLCIALILVGALLAASTGIVGATVVTMGALSLPTMLSRRYSPELSCGTITAAGTLGQIIPPSIVLVILGDMMNVPVADLFAAALLPGMLLVGLYMLYVVVQVRLKPDLAPAFAPIESHEY